MKLEIGKRYIRRDGSVTGPLTLEGQAGHPFFDGVWGKAYDETGRWGFWSIAEDDLISEYVDPNLDNNLDSDLDKDARIAELEAQLTTDLHCAKAIMKQRDQLKARVEELEDVETAYRVVLQDSKRIATERNTLRTQLAAVTAERDENAAHYGYWQNEAMKASEELAAYKQPKLVGRTWQINGPRATCGSVFTSRGSAEAHASGTQIGYLRRDTYSDGSVKCELEPV